MSDVGDDMRPLDPGQIRFVHHVLPPLVTGEFEVEVDQEVEREGIGSTGSETFQAVQRLQVGGPRFGIAPADVHAAYPPPDDTGNHGETLPHVVLRRRTLPWEIDLFGDNETRRRPVPWMGLLVFHDGEGATVQTGARSVLLDPRDSAVRVPQLASLASDGDPTITVVDIGASALRSVIPTVRDLPWTAHVREVRTGGKELLGQIDDGWFSVVIANRLPAPGENTVHLVSFEGWGPQIRSSKNRRGSKPFRMVSLASWTFTSTDRGSFETKMNQLDDGLLVANRPPRAANDGSANDGAAPDAATIVAEAVADGFVPLRYDMRQGEQTVAWYRGPLTPKPVPHALERGPFPRAEAALIYHPSLAMFDVSQAVAWQIGRLLALSDPTFAADLMTWRQAGQAQVDRLLARDEALERHGQLDAFRRVDELVGRVDRWRDDADRGEPWSEEDRVALTADLRAFVLDLWDPNAIATTIADFAESDVLTRLVLDDVVPPRPDGKRLLGEARGG